MENGKDQEQARELFRRYQGNRVLMHREGVLKSYQEFEIPAEQETQWLQEIVAEGIAALSIRDWEAISRLETVSKHYQDPVMVEQAASFASRNILSADSVVRLMYAESLVGVIRSNKKVLTRELLFSACRIAVQILDDVIAQPLVVDPGHEPGQLGLKDKRALNSRAKKGIEEIEKLLN